MWCHANYHHGICVHVYDDFLPQGQQSNPRKMDSSFFKKSSWKQAKWHKMSFWEQKWEELSHNGHKPGFIEIFVFSFRRLNRCTVLLCTNKSVLLANISLHKSHLWECRLAFVGLSQLSSLLCCLFMPLTWLIVLFVVPTFGVCVAVNVAGVVANCRLALICPKKNQISRIWNQDWEYLWTDVERGAKWLFGV